MREIDVPMKDIGFKAVRGAKADSLDRNQAFRLGWKRGRIDIFVKYVLEIG